MIILGIDPGSIRAGFGFIEWDSKGSLDQGEASVLECGVIELTKADSFEHRLQKLGLQLAELVQKFQPHTTVLERIFLGKNADSAFKLGHARGVCMYEAKKNGSRVVEYAAREVKKGITGKGNAEKEQVALIVKACLGLPVLPALPLDATDALALAYHHATLLQLRSRFRDSDISL